MTFVPAWLFLVIVLFRISRFPKKELSILREQKEREKERLKRQNPSDLCTTVRYYGIEDRTVKSSSHCLGTDSLCSLLTGI